MQPPMIMIMSLSVNNGKQNYNNNN